MLNKRISFVVLLHTAFSVTIGRDMCGCRYLFIEQPSNSIMCNPYATGSFVTRCVVDFSTTEGIPLSLDWYSKAQFSSTPELLTNGFTTFNDVTSVRSRLTIPLTPETATSHEGFRYFCRVKFSNGTIFQDSQEVYLFSEHVVTEVLNYPDCEPGYIQSTLFEECIDPLFKRDVATTTAEPTTAPSTDPPPPPTTTAAETTPPPTTTPLPTTPPPTTAPPTTAPPTTAPPTTAPPTTTPPTTAPPPPTTAPPTTPAPPIPPPTTPPPITPPPTVSDSPVGRGNELTADEEILLYAAIAAAIVLIMIVIFLLLCLCLCNRVCRQSKYCTCCSPY